jgi:hypothetical protein
MFLTSYTNNRDKDAFNIFKLLIYIYIYILYKNIILFIIL